MIRFAEEKDFPYLKEIWHACFEDDAVFVDSYYWVTRQIARHLIYCEPDSSRIVAMLDLLPVEVCQGKQVQNAVYIYAAATLPEFQGQGIMHTLLEEACRIAAQQGYAFALLIPQTQPLVAFYQKQGFVLPLYKSVKSYDAFDPNPCHANRIFSCSEENFMKQKSLYEQKQQNKIRHSEAFLRCVYHQVLASGGSVMQMYDQIYAICYPEKDAVFVQEISCETEELKDLLPKLGRYFRKKTVRVQRPGTDQLYGLAKPLADRSAADVSDVYMNTMLD